MKNYISVCLLWHWAFCALFLAVLPVLTAQKEALYYYYLQPQANAQGAKADEETGVQTQAPDPTSPDQTDIDPSAQSRAMESSASKPGHQNGISFSAQAGYLYGELQELEMAGSNDKFDLESQLIWKMQDTLSISLSFELLLNRFYMKLGANVPLIMTKAPMEHRDWLFDNPPSGGQALNLPASAPSHYSTSATVNELSFSIQSLFTVNLLEQNHAPRLEVGVAFLYMSWGWRALDTEGFYLLNSSGELVSDDLRPSSGDTIRYRIHYLVPALSARFAARWGIYEIQALLNYSPMAIFLDRKEHIATRIDSDGFGFLGQMVWGGLTNHLWATRNWSVNFGLRGKVLFRTRLGVLKQNDKNTGETLTTQDAAGSEYFDIEVFVGITLRF